MALKITVQDLYDALRERLSLRILGGQGGLGRVIFDDANRFGDHIVAGPMNFVHPTPVQTIGPTERAYLAALDPAGRHEALSQLFGAKVAAVILVNHIEPDAEMQSLIDASDTVLLSSPMRDNLVLDNLQYYASKFLAQRTHLHGVFLEVLGMGVLITGSAAVGKSELALELIVRGHRLIADDAPEFSRIAPDIVNGACPLVLRGFLEVRGLGILDIPAMFGDSAIKRDKYLQLIVHLEPLDAKQIQQLNRLEGSHRTRQVLGVEIPEVTVPVAPGRNLAILVETAVRNHMLKLKGYDATDAFVQRQQQAIHEGQGG